ncbi:hypothetical protein NHH03_27795, partial [Stieleria sp. TO1_6]|uniref:beta strand repeat-containing protein n=1 Tax=Stieleria tagensis TaxID=2956795 RepID=UPI00209B7857|nr:hypothetical protein [Stieleria tagensis]
TGIGSSGQAIDTDVGTIAAQTTASGGVFINELDALTIGVGSGGVSGITAASGGSVDIDAGGMLSIATGSRVLAGGNATTLTLDATSMSLNAGSAGTETVQNTGSGTITLTATAGNITLDHHSVGAGSGTVSIDVGTQSILAAQASGTAEINAAGTVAFNAATIGSNNNHVDLEGATELQITDTGAGDMYLGEVTASTIQSTSITVGDVAYGTIIVDYFDTDFLAIDTNHLLYLVQHDASNRNFDYTALAGDVSVNSINTGIAATTVTAVDGAINESVSGTSTNITTDGVLTLSATSGIGNTGAIDTNVGTLAAQTTDSGGVAIRDIGDVTVGSGAGGINGVSAAIGGDVDLDALGTVTVAAASQVSGGGDGTAVTIDAGGIELQAGTSGNESVNNSGDGTVTLTATASGITLDNDSIGVGTGDLNLNANGQTIGVAQATATAEITTGGVVNVDAAAVGSLTQSLDIDGATALTINDSGAGAMSFGEVGGQTITATTITVGDVGYGSIDIDYS